MSKSDWYGHWVWDYLNHERDDLANEAFESFDIWKQAYLKAHPEFCELDDLELMEYHYHRWTRPLWNSWIFKAWVCFYRPNVIMRQLIWRIRRKFS